VLRLLPTSANCWALMTIVGVVGCESGANAPGPTPSAPVVASAPSSTTSSQVSSGTPEVGTASAEATLQKLKEATAKADFESQFRLFTPAKQEPLLAGVLVGLGIHAGSKKVGDQFPERQERLRAILRRHGVSHIEKVEPVPSKLTQELSAVKDRAQLYGELQALFGEPMKKQDGKVVQLKHARVSEVRDVVENGDQATATLVILAGDGEEKTEAAELRKVDGAWYVDVLSLAPHDRVVTQ